MYVFVLIVCVYTLGMVLPDFCVLSIDFYPAFESVVLKLSSISWCLSLIAIIEDVMMNTFRSLVKIRYSMHLAELRLLCWPLYYY
jgi:hypothetical protein